jgi:monovalent cation:H+ antiporter-2, CPA2 family
VADSELFLDILLVTSAAFVGGVIAHYFRLPTIVGFLAAGVAIGPATPGPVGRVEDVERIADLGVILLMFGLGIQFSFRQMVAHRRLTLGGGALQIVLTGLLGLLLGVAAGLAWQAALILGFLVANTSTVVAVKVLEARRQVASVHGTAALSISIVQDLSAVLMILVIPSLGGDALLAIDVLLALGKGTLLIAVAYLMSTYLLPVVWRHLARTRSRELSLLAALTLAIGLAAGSALLGLSLAFGAFLAGLAVSESEFGYQTLADIIPLREIFATVFFIGMGMLIVPSAAIDDAPMVALIVATIVIGKGLISMAAVRFVGLALGPAIMTGLVLAQVGEFSFVIARTSMIEGVISEEIASAFLAAAVISILINPAMVRYGPALVAALEKVPGLSARPTSGPSSDPAVISGLRRHVVILGYGGTGAAIARNLAGRNLPFVVVDLNPFVLEDAGRLGIPFVYGDGTSPEILAKCNVGQANVLAITIPNALDAERAALNARNINPDIDIVARGFGPQTNVALRRAGAAEVVQPEFEAGLEFVRHVLHRYGVDAREITALQARRRAEHYRS